MSLLFGLKALQQDTDEANPHILGYATARVAANALLVDVWNAATSAGREFAVDLNGKMYSGALTAGDILYAVTGGVTGVRRLDSLAIGTANQVLRVNSGATAPEWSSSLSGLTLASPTLSGTITVTGPMTITSTTANQLSVRYDGSNHMTVDVSSTGAVTLNATGAGARFTFSDQIFTNTLNATSISGAQLNLLYDVSNHLAVTVSSAGAVTYNATGASAGHSFSEALTVASGNITATSGGVVAAQTVQGGGIYCATTTFGVICNSGALATTATDGHLAISSCAGTPTGVPITGSISGVCAMIYDTSNNRLYIYNGAWRSVLFA